MDSAIISTLLNIEIPIVLAPMAGGATTPELIAAVSNCGGLGSLGAALMTAEAIDAAITQIKNLTDRPFQVNLFSFESPQVDESKLKTMQNILQPFYQQYQLDMPTIIAPTISDHKAKLDVVIKHKVPIVSITFGLFEQEVKEKLQSYGAKLMATANSLQDAQSIQSQGYDVVIAQGVEAGGHRAGLGKDERLPTQELVAKLKAHISTPIIAAGGMMDGKDIVEILQLGADAAQLGTAFLSCPESGIAECYKQKLLEATKDQTALTKVFTGRYARGINNQFINVVTPHEQDLLEFPLQGHLTSPIRQAATKAENTELMSVWAGQGVARSTGLPAKELMQQLIKETKE
jgi:nitronate monooxygenase